MSARTRTKRPNSRSGSLGQFLRSREVIVHQSCAARMIPNPDPLGHPFPWIERPGKTYNVGRNKAKRERRAVSKALRAGGAA